jgi:hypothetical protein
MKAYSNSPLSAKDRVVVSAITLLSLFTWHSPVTSMAYAQTATLEKALVFEIKSQTNISSNSLAHAEKLALEQRFAQVDKRVQLVRAYLESKNAPLAQYTEILLAQEDWKKIIAISNAESNMGKRCYKNNCSGIMFRTGGLRSYESIPEWIVDFQGLIDRRYKTKSLDQMNGVYVVPRSANWYKASNSVYQALEQIEKQTPITTVNAAA